MEGFFGLILLIAIGVGIYKLAMKFGLGDHLRNKDFAAEAARRDARMKPHQEARAQQLADLQASLPSTPPERMRAMIRVNPITAYTTLPKESDHRQFEEVDIQHYSVDMILELSERDRATILQNHLDQVVLEKVPAYLGDEILNILAEFDKRYNSHSSTSSDGLLMRAMMDQQRRNYESYAAERKDITLADYMKAPYSRIFKTLPEANDYSDKLKTELLPKVKELLDRNVDRKATETVEF